MVVWITGLSGAGKTTICQIVYSRLKPALPEMVLLDGDAIRDSFSTDLSFTEEDRTRQITRVQRLARMLSAQNLVVLVAVVYANPELLAWNRANIPGYLEALVDTSLTEVEARDTKGLYGRARRGETANVVGVDIPWHRPLHPDLVIDTSKHPTADDGARAIENAMAPLLSRRVQESGEPA